MNHLALAEPRLIPMSPRWPMHLRARFGEVARGGEARGHAVVVVDAIPEGAC